MQYPYDGDLAVSYLGNPPPFIWTALESLYHSSFCSEAHLKAYASVDHQTHTWVSRQAGVIDAVLLFNIKNHSAVVLNELIALSNIHIDRFSIYIFEKYHAVKIIQFKALYQQEQDINFPHQAFVFSENFILTLPESTDLWLQSLTKKMRATLRYQMTRSQRVIPQCIFRCIAQHEITPLLVQHVLMLSRLRMQKKGKRFGLSDSEAQCLMVEMRERGVIYALEVDGKIIAGLLCTFCGKDLFFHIIAHDLAFDAVRAGLLCCYHSIVAAINNKYERINFLWGRYQYKLQLGAQEKKLIKLTVFRKTYYQFIFPAWFMQKKYQQIKQLLKAVRSKFF